jgi:hypothetical protein
LGILTQSYSGHSGDLETARVLAHQAIFDNQNGAVNTIRTFENNVAWSGTGCAPGAVTLENMSLVNRQACQLVYFTNQCTRALNPVAYQNGLCSTPVNPQFSLPVLRLTALGASAFAPCATYTINNSGTIPLLDINNAANNGHPLYAFEYVSTKPGLCTNPRYQIEMLNSDYQLDGTVANANYVSSARLYRVTSRAFGLSGNTQATEQAYFYVRCPTAACNISLLSDTLLK